MTAQIAKKITTYEAQLAKLDTSNPADSNLAQYIKERIKDFSYLLLKEKAKEGELIEHKVKLHVAAESACESCE